MESALIVLVLSVVMVLGGRFLMLHDRRSKYEGLLSCVLGASLVISWYTYHAGDFDDLADFAVRRVQRMLSTSQDPIPIAMVALVPASIAFILLMAFNYTQGGGPRSIRSIFGPLGRVRRPRVLR
jgi:hypothetical protein